MYRRGRSDKTGSAFILFLLLDQAHRLGLFRNGRRPPVVTLAMMGACFFVHFFTYELRQLLPFSMRIEDTCIYGPAILAGDWKRLFLAAFVHADDTHLYYNLVSLLWKGTQLESRMGSPAFLALSAGMIFLSHSLTVLSALGLREIGHGDHWRTCAVGISALLFALKTILNQDPNTPRESYIYGFRVPTKHVAWAELVFIQLLVPNASFLGHCCGILAGLSYVYVWPIIRRALAASQTRAADGEGRRGGFGGGVLGTGPRVVRRPELAAATPYAQQMQQMWEMGFHDRAANAAALRAARGDIERAIANYPVR